MGREHAAAPPDNACRRIGQYLLSIEKAEAALLRLGELTSQAVGWIPCSNPEAADLTEAKYLLCEGGWTREKLFIFDPREEFGLTSVSLPIETSASSA